MKMSPLKGQTSHTQSRVKMSFIKIFFLFYWWHLTFCRERPLIEVIADFVDNQPPTKITAYLECWNKGRKVNLIKALKTTPTGFKRFNGIIEILEFPNHQMFLLDSGCSNYKAVLDEANTRGLFSLPFRWLFIGSAENITGYLNIMIDSRFYVLEKGNGNDNYAIKAIYKPSNTDNEYIQNDVALWNEKFQYYNELGDTLNRSDVRGAVVNASLVITNSDSLKHLWDYRNKHIDTVSKINYILCYHLLEHLNATANFVTTPTWGYKTNATTNIFSGMIGELQAGRADVGASVAFITHERLDAVEYIAPTSETRVRFIFRAPPLSYVTNVFTLPFSQSVWYASFALIGVLSVILYVIVRWEWAEEEFNRGFEVNRSVLLPDFAEVLIVNFGGVTQQGSESEPRSSSGRITYLFGFIAMMFLYTSYSANIVALLQSTSDSINSVEDLLYSRIKLGVEIAPYSKYFFEADKEPTRKAMYEQKIAPKGTMENFMDIPTGVKRMKEEFFAMHAQATHIYKIVYETFQENEKCALREIKVWQLTDPQLPARRNTSYKELLKVGFRRMHEGGVQFREYTKLFSKKPTCQGTGGSFINVGLIECYYAFLIFGIGCAISLILLIVEVLVHRRRHRLQNSYEAATECIKKRNRVKKFLDD